MHKSRTFLWVGFTLTVFLVVIPVISAAEDKKPSGTVLIESTAVAVEVEVN